MRPTLHIQPNTDILVKFKNDDDEDEFYKGTVTEIHDLGDTHIVCHIKYEDGEEVPDSVLYDKDYEQLDTEDTWKFVRNPMWGAKLPSRTAIDDELKEESELAPEETEPKPKPVIDEYDDDPLDEPKKQNPKNLEEKSSKLVKFVIKTMWMYLPLVYFCYHYNLCFCKAK
jgi:hypothetical protein